MSATPRTSAPVDVTTLDFDAIFARQVKLFGSLYPAIALEKADLARMHLEAMANLGDLFAYYLNQQGRESRMVTGQLRTNILALSRMLTYRPATAVAATYTETFTLTDGPAAAQVTIAAGRVVRTEDVANPVRCYLTEDVVIAAGQSSGSGTVEHAEPQSETYLSNGQADQVFALLRSPYLDGGTTIATAAGEWTEVETFLSSVATDLHYTVTVDAQDRATVTFGNGQAGAVPLGPITFAYKTGGGTEGNIAAGTLTVIEGSVTNAVGVTVRVAASNGAVVVEGQDRQSTASIKLRAPAQVQVQRRTVSRTDYEAVAEDVPGVAYALMLTRNESTSVLENEGFLYVVPTDGGTASDALLTSVAEVFGDAVAVGSSGVFTTRPTGAKPKTITFQLRVVGALYKVINVQATIHLRKGAVRATVRAAVQAALEAFFAIQVDALTVGGSAAGLVPNPRLNFGYYLQDVDGEPTGSFAFSDLYNAVRDADGVLKVDAGAGGFLLNGSRQDVPINLYEFPKLGTVTLIDPLGQLL